MRTNSWIGRLLLGVAAACMVTALVQAHTKLEKSEPAADSTVAASPKWVQLFFNEVPDQKVSKVEVTGPSGKIETGPVHSMADKDLMAAFPGTLANGKYTVNWQTAGKDGHVIKGAFSFTVQVKAQ